MSITPATPIPRAQRGRIARALLIVCVVIVVVLSGLYWYASTPQFAGRVRSEVIEVLERSTGGRVELGSFTWRLSRFEVQVNDLTIHGLEGPGEVPYAHLDKLLIRAKIISIFRAQIGLRLLQAEHPVLHLIVYPDGGTNQPVPKTEAKSSKASIDDVFDLAVDHLQIDDGLVMLNQRKIPFNIVAQDLVAGLNYVHASGHYNGSLEVADLSAQHGKAPLVHSRLDMKVDLARDEAKLTGLHFVSGDSTLDVSGDVKHLNDPHWQVTAKGSIDLQEVAALAGVDGLGPGAAVLNVAGSGAGTRFDLSGNAGLHDAAYKSSVLLVSRLNAATSLHITQDEINAPNLVVKLQQGGEINVDARLLHWMTPTLPTTITAAQKTTRPVVTRGNAPQQQATIAVKIRGVGLQTLLEMAAAKRYRDMGFDSALSGTANLAWTGTIAALTAETKLQLSPPVPAAAGRVPVSGVVDAAYVNHGGRLDVHDLEVHTPGSSLRVSGQAGVYPATGPASLKVDLSLTNLAEFNRALMAAGISANGRQGTAALPISLQGQAGFHGDVTGSLLAPAVQRSSLGNPVHFTHPGVYASHAGTEAAVRSHHTQWQSGAGGKTQAVVKAAPTEVKTQSIQWDDLESGCRLFPGAHLIAAGHADARKNQHSGERAVACTPVASRQTRNSIRIRPSM